MDITKGTVFNFIEEYGIKTINNIFEYLPIFVLAIFILFIGFRVANFLSRWLIHISQKSDYIDETFISFISYVVRYLIIFASFLVVLDKFGINIMSMVALLGAAGLAIGLALQNLLSNIAASLLISIIRPFKINDYVSAGSGEGFVTEINLFMVRIRSANGTEILIPNNKILSENIIKYYPENPLRYDFDFKVNYKENIDTITDILLTVVQDNEHTLSTPPPEVRVINIANGYVEVKLCSWVISQEYWGYTLQMNRQCLKALVDNNIFLYQPELFMRGNK